MFNGFIVCLIVTIASIIILRYIVGLFGKGIRNKMMDIAYEKIKIDDCYVYRQSKSNTRPRYACVIEKKIEDGIRYIYYRSINYNGYLSKYEMDDLTINDNIDEFIRKYEIKDNPLKRFNLKIDSIL